MKSKRTTARTHRTEAPYDAKSKAATLKYWEQATAHKSVAELRATRGRPAKAIDERKEQIALRVDKDVLAWYRAQGAGWQTRMNAVLKAFRDANM
jgi:uncharacterized protein (DUF4415 family)